MGVFHGKWGASGAKPIGNAMPASADPSLTKNCGWVQEGPTAIEPVRLPRLPEK